MTRSISILLASLVFLFATGSLIAQVEKLESHVKERERAFAQTMADRDFEAFKSFLSEETIFFAGESPLRGKEATASAWALFFEPPEAPFSWEPETVVVLESGGLALSSGPVRNPAGERVATFNSVWRRDSDGTWRIIFDKGYRYCEPPPVAEAPASDSSNGN